MVENRRRHYDNAAISPIDKLLAQIDDTDDPVIRSVLMMVMHVMQETTSSSKALNEILPVVQKHNTIITKAMAVWGVGLWILSAVQVMVLIAGGFVFNNVLDLIKSSERHESATREIMTNVAELKLNAYNSKYEFDKRIADLQNQLNDLMRLRVIKGSK